MKGMLWVFVVLNLLATPAQAQSETTVVNRADSVTHLKAEVGRLLQKGRFAEARQALQVADPSDPQISLWLRQLSAMSEGETLLSSAGLINPFDPEALEQSLKGIAANGETESLTALYSWLTTHEFDRSERTDLVYLNHLIAVGKNEEAYRQIRRLSEQYQSANFRRLKAVSCDQLGLTDCVINTLQPLWLANKFERDGRLLVTNLMKQRRIQEARPIFAELRARKPDAAWSRKTAKAIDRAVEAHILSLQRHYRSTADADHAMALGRYLYINDRHDQAIDFLQMHRQKGGESPKLDLMLGRYLSWQGRSPELIALAESVSDAVPELRLLQAKAEAWGGSREKALPLLLTLEERLLAESPGQTEILWQTRLMLGYSYLWQEDREKALSYFEPLQKVRSRTLDKDALNRGILQARQDYAGLINLARKAYSDSPERHELALQLANYYELSGSATDAIRYYERYLKQRPQHAEARLNLGRVYMKQGAVSDALKQMERYGYQLFTKSSLTILAKNYQWADQPREAVLVLDSLRYLYPDDPAVERMYQELSDKIGFQPQVSNYQSLIEADKAFYTQQYELATARYSRYLGAAENSADRLNPDVIARYRYSQAHSLSNRDPRFTSEFQAYDLAAAQARNGQYVAARIGLANLSNRLPTYPGLPLGPERFIWQWLDAWKSQDIERYRQFYVKRISEDQSWLRYKTRVFANSEYIRVMPVALRAEVLSGDQVGIRRYRIRFYQYYKTNVRTDLGEKELQLYCQALHCLIEKESWSPVLLQANNRRELGALVKLELFQLRDKILQAAPGDRRINDLLIANGLAKDTEPEESLLNRYSAEVVSVDTGGSGAGGLIDQDRYARKPDKPTPRPNQFGLNYRYFSDSDDVRYRMPGARLKYGYGPYDIRLEAGRFRFDSPQCVDDSGATISLLLERNRFNGGVRIDELNGSVRAFPYLSQGFQRGNVSHRISFASQSLFFDKLSCQSLRKELRRHSLGYERYQVLRDGQSLWLSAAMGSISDGNRDFVGQFDYVFQKRRWHGFDYEAALSGWYLWNRDQSDDYYSPEFYDSTRLRFRGHADFGTDWGLITDLGLGYTLEDSRELYSLGLWLQRPFDRDGLLRLGCGRNNSSASNLGESSYTSSDCRAEVEYYWE